MKPVAWQFKCKDTGAWVTVDESIKVNRKNTEAAGYETRDLYAADTDAAATTIPREVWDHLEKHTAEIQIERMGHDLTVLAEDSK